MRVAIANFSTEQPSAIDFRRYWASFARPERPARVSLFEQRYGWGFHITAMAVRLLDLGLATEAEFWLEGDTRGATYDAAGVLRVTFANTDDVRAYIDRFGAPDLFINYGRAGRPMLEALRGRSFRVHVACLRAGLLWKRNYGAECYLVDDPRYLTASAMLYIPVVNTAVVRPADRPRLRDFIYLASAYGGKRQDLLLDAVRGTSLTGHFHPVNGQRLDLTDTLVTTSDWDQADVVELLQTSRFAAYPADVTSNPAAMWECVAAGLPIVVNERIHGGKHVIVPGVTGELARPSELRDALTRMRDRYTSYRPAEYFAEHWDTIGLLDRYFAFFESHGWQPTKH